MKRGIWYACTLKHSLLHLKEGTYYIRLVPFDPPLAVGTVWVLFNPKRNISLRLSRAVDLEETLSLFPNNVTPMPAPEAKNKEIETQYAAFLRRNPIAKRVPSKPTTLRDSVALQ